MKNLLMAVMAVITVAGSAYAGIPGQLEIGAEAPNKSQVMKDVSGEGVTLEELNDENGLLVMFSCNTCPYVLAWQDRYYEIAKICEANDIGLVLVNSNEARRGGVDSYEAMQKHSKSNEYTFRYALDTNHELADAFGAKKTPDVFLFDNDLKLVYKGAIDDNHKSAEDVKEAYLKDAVASMLAGEVIEPNATLAIGCTIKRVQ